jgi:hypothetical protein
VRHTLFTKYGSSLQTKPRGFLTTGAYIVRRETPLALYKGLGAVLSGIVPKMAIRFASFEAYKGWLADKETGKTSVGMIFIGTPLDHIYYFLFDQEYLSWSGCWNDGSRRCCDANGGCQDPVAGSATLFS